MNDARLSLDPVPDQPDRPAGASRGRGQLLRRTFIIAVILVSGGLLSSGALELFFRYRESVEGVGTLQREMAGGAAFKIQQFVQDIEHTMRAATQTPDIVATGLTEAYQFHLTKLLKVAPALTTVAALDLQGHEQLKASRAQIVWPEDLRKNMFPEALTQVRAGKTFFGPVYFVHASEPRMTMAVPMERFAGEVVGVLSAEVNLKYIRDVIAGIRVGQAGYAYVVSRQGELLAHPDISLVLQKRNVQHLGQVQAALAGATPRLALQANLLGQQVLASYATIPALQWAVLVERPAAEAYAPLYASLLRISFLLIIGLGMAVVASLLIGRRVVRPLAVLQQGAVRIGSGDFAHRLEITTGDEFQTLADEFNRMATHLQASYATLEQKVAERTQALARSVAELQALGEITTAVNSSLELPTVLTTIVAYAVQLSGADSGAVYEYDAATQVFWLRTSHACDAVLRAALRATPLRRGQGAMGRAAAAGEPIQLSDRRDTDVSLDPLRDVMQQFGLLSLLAVPLLREERILGGLVVFRQACDAFPADIVELLRTFATESALAIQNARLFRELEENGQQLAAQAEQLAKWNHTLEQRVHDQVTQLEHLGRLKRFFSPQVADIIVSTGGEQLLASHRREITVVFCDLRGFTAFAEIVEPAELMTILREYHTTLGTLIFHFEGTLERFAGDGLMVFFNDPLPCPDPAARAVRMAVAMHQQMQELTARWRQRGHQLVFGVGIAQGDATLGMIGFEGRVDYGAIGPVTNLASRLCDEAKGGQLLISHQVYTQVEHLIHAESVGELSFKGFSRPMPVFNVLGLQERAAS